MKSLSVVILACNVSKDLSVTYQNVVRALGWAGLSDHEIILVTSDWLDGTNDGTPAIADAIASENPDVLRNHGRYANRAQAFIQGLAMASKDFVTWVPGDNVITEESLCDIFACTGKADVIIGYTINGHIRPARRRILSWSMARCCNLLFGLRVKYYSGICIFPRRPLQEIPLPPDAIGFMIEAVVRLLKSGASYTEVPQRINPTSGSTIGNWKSVLSGLRVILRLFQEARRGL